MLLPRLPLQGSRFDINAVGSLCLPKLVYYTSSAFHSQHVLKHISDSHRLHIDTRGAVSCIQQLEHMEGQRSHLNAFLLLELACEFILVQISINPQVKSKSQVAAKPKHISHCFAIFISSQTHCNINVTVG